MRDTLPYKINKYETGVVNLDSVTNAGTHWVCYQKCNTDIYYFDSFGNLKPPLELITYFNTSDEKPIKVRYNYNNYQSFDSVVCGHLCLQFLLTKKCFV